MNDSWKLLVVAGPDEGRVFPVTKERPLVIGRGTNSDTQIRDPRLSRIHCELRFDGARFILSDAGSSGGTLVGGRPIASAQPLANGAEFQIGDSRLKLQSDNPLDAPTLSPETAPKRQASVGRLQELVGETFYRYRIDTWLTTGKSSAIFKAFDVRRKRPVALKILKPQLVSTDVQLERFVRAIRTMLPVRHRHIVRLYKAGRTGPYCWAALEWIDGSSLADLIELTGVQGMLDWKAAWQVAVDIARALEEASRRQIVHRNITPTNILRRSSDRSYVLSDLVLARALEQTDAPQITNPGEAIGELAYIAPERVLDPSAVDARSDQYGLGATLYRLLTGQPPRDVATISELLESLRTFEPRPPIEFRLGSDERFSELVMRLLRKSPERRFPSATALLADLERIGKLGGLSVPAT